MQSFLEKAEELNALKFGDFTLKSGIKSKYFFDISKFFDNSSLSILSKHYVELILENNFVEETNSPDWFGYLRIDQIV